MCEGFSRFFDNFFSVSTMKKCWRGFFHEEWSSEKILRILAVFLKTRHWLPLIVLPYTVEKMEIEIECALYVFHSSSSKSHRADPLQTRSPRQWSHATMPVYSEDDVLTHTKNAIIKVLSCLGTFTGERVKRSAFLCFSQERMIVVTHYCPSHDASVLL